MFTVQSYPLGCGAGARFVTGAIITRFARYICVKNCKMKRLIYIISLLLTVVSAACIEDSVSTSPSDQPAFSTDTLQLGTVFTTDGSPTSRLTVYNRHSKVISIGSISLRDDAGHCFRINVDGMAGRTFSNVEIRPNDSIFVYVETTLPVNDSDEPVIRDAHLDFVTAGVSQTVVLRAIGQDVYRQRGTVIESDTRWRAGRPYQVFDSLIVAKGATLTVDAGTVINFHDKAYMRVDGTLVCLGTPERPVQMTGDRTGNVAASIPYELMSGQWGGILFSTDSHDNILSHTSIRNSQYGVVLDSIPSGDNPALTLVNTQIRNTQGYVITAIHSDVTAYGCEFTDASQGILYMRGGRHRYDRCTIANYYLFTALGGAAVQFDHFDGDSDDGSGLPLLDADITNTIIYGNGTDLSAGDLTGTAVTLRRCLLKSAGSDDDNFIGCLWDSDPLYYTVREEYLFDYRLKPESPAIGAAEQSLTPVLPHGIAIPDTDLHGVRQNVPADIGAYNYVAPEK